MSHQPNMKMQQHPTTRITNLIINHQNIMKIQQPPQFAGHAENSLGKLLLAPFARGAAVLGVLALFAAPPTASADLTSATTTVGGRSIVTFTGGSGTWTVPDGVSSIDVLVVGGGGGGGRGSGGGGGAGGLIYQTGFAVGGSVSITVGTGGIGDNGSSGPGNGSDSVFSTLTAFGGGCGAPTRGGLTGAGIGGSGGGGSWLYTPGAAGTSGQGNSGGACTGAPGYGGGGGGGAGAVGGVQVSGVHAGNGGAGLAYAISGTSTYYAGGGGGGGAWNANTPGGSGGSGGGGAGASGTAAAISGTANTGGGGGGGYNQANTNGAAGGSGVVIVSYGLPPTKLAFSSLPASPTAGESFSVTVQAQDDSNYPQAVTSDTAIQLSVTSGTGTLSGTTTGTIVSGTNSVVISGVVYSSAEAMTLQAAVSSGTSLSLGTTNLTFAGQPTVATPTFSLTAGGYLGARSVTINCATSGSTVYYTTDGSIPNNSSPNGGVGTASATVSIPAPANLTIKTYATCSGYLDSAVASATYVTLTGTVWTNTAGGSWPTAGNWLEGVVGQGSGVTADFSTLTLSANTTVTLDSSPTVGGLVFGDVGNARTWTIDPGSGGTLTLDAGGGSPAITVNNQIATLSAPLTGAAGMTKSGAGKLILAAANTFSGGSVTVNEGTLQLNGPTTPGKGQLTGVTTITVNAGATLLANVGDAFGWTAGMEALIINGGTVTGSSGTSFSFGEPVTMTGGTLSTTGGGYIAVWGNTINATSDADGNPASISGILQQGGPAVFSVTRGPLAPVSDLNVSAVGQRFGGSYLQVSGDGVMTLSGNNTYPGATKIDTATLIMGGAGQWFGGTSSYSILLSNDGSLIYASSADQTLNGTITGAGSLTQRGPGKLTLNGATSYTGNTTVNAGTLSMRNASLDDASTVTIASGGVLDLNFDETGGDVTDIVANLVIDSVVMPGGVYGATGSGATTIDDTHFSGVGTLTVTATGGNYESWASDPAHTLTGGPTAVGNDGIPNLVVYALDLKTDGTNGSPGTMTGNLLSFTKRTDAVTNGDVTYAIEESDDLGLNDPWTPVAAEDPALTNNDTTISYTLPAGKTKTFARLVVTQVP